MDSIPVLGSKLIMPELPEEFLLTGRLKRLHREMELHRAVTVCAPAGYGKTTLAVSFFDCHLHSRTGACWYRLEPDDRSLLVFISHLLENLFPKGKAAFTGAKAVFKDPALWRQPRQIITLICRELWKLYEQNALSATFIVIDDYQNAAHSAEIRSAIIYMLDHIPPPCRIFLLSRYPGRIFTEKQKLEYKLLLIEKNDLTFEKVEIELLVQKIKRGEPDVKTVNAIVKNTEGWIAGIIMLCKTQGNEYLDDSFKNGSLSSEDSIFSYISTEAFKEVDKATGDALAKLSLLRDFSVDDAKNILGTGDVMSLVKRCLEFGIFIEKLPGTPPVYRFQPLFKDFLLTVLKERFSVEQIESWQLAAAAYYIETSRFGRAAEHIAQCGNIEKTAEMVTGVGIRFMIVGESGQLRIWLEMLPREIVDNNPVLLVFKALLMPQAMHKDAGSALARAFQVAQAQGNLLMQYRAATSLVYLHFCNNNMAGIVKAAESILDQNPGIWSRLTYVPGLLEIMRSIGKSNFMGGREWGIRIPYSEMTGEDRWLFLAYSCIIDFCLGRLDDAERRMETALSLECVKNVEPAKATALYLLSTVVALKNDWNKLSGPLAELITLATKYDFLYHLAGAKRLASYERYLDNDTGEAVKLLDEAALLYTNFDNRAMAASARLLKRLWVGKTGAADFMEECLVVDIVRRQKAGILLHEICLSMLGAIARDAGDFIFAEKCLLSSIRAAGRKKGVQVLCGACFHIAALYFMSGNMEQGRCYLKQAMTLASDGRFFMFWDIHIPTIVEMTLRGIRYRYHPCFGRELLAKLLGGNTAHYLIEKVKVMPESHIHDFALDFLSAREKGVERDFYIVHATLFGKPEIKINGVKIPDSEWKTRKNKCLLEYLLLNSGKSISREKLIDIFWPESDGKPAMTSLRTALYQLRKTLSRYEAAVKGENAFIYETLDGVKIRVNDALVLDLHQFLKLNQDISRPGSGEVNGKLIQKDILKNMISLYRGELLETSDYGDEYIYEREMCKTIFEEACLNLSAIYITENELHTARKTLSHLLEEDPYNEKACLELLKLYISQGMQSKAARLYKSFKIRLQEDLGIEVDERLTGLLNDAGLL